MNALATAGRKKPVLYNVFHKLPIFPSAFQRGPFVKGIVINGPMGVERTATGRAIADIIPGTALIDGDWCMDIHPFVGKIETKAMAVDNILHMVGSFRRCSECGARGRRFC